VSGGARGGGYSFRRCVSCGNRGRILGLRHVVCPRCSTPTVLLRRCDFCRGEMSDGVCDRCGAVEVTPIVEEPALELVCPGAIRGRCACGLLARLVRESPRAHDECDGKRRCRTCELRRPLAMFLEGRKICRVCRAKYMQERYEATQPDRVAYAVLQRANGGSARGLRLVSDRQGYKQVARAYKQASRDRRSR
jgi:hypothetical protein